MKSFAYEGRDRQGSSRHGIIEASDIRQAASTLREHGIFVVSLAPKSDSAINFLMSPFQKVTEADLVTFTRQLSVMIPSGLPLADALTILKHQSTPAMANLVAEILRDIEGGSSLSSSLEKKPKIFSRIYMALIRAGETAGVLDQILTRLADTLEKQREFKSKTKGALIYPVIVVVAMILVAFVMMIFVIPKLTAMYKDLSVELPTPTKILIFMSNFTTTNWWVVVVVFALLYFLFSRFSKTKFGRYRIELLMFSLPVFGPLRKEILLAEFTRTLSLLAGAGIPIIDSLNIVADGMDSMVLADGIREAALRVEKGFPLASVFETNPNFPPILAQMIRVGEETGKIDEVLRKISVYFETESDYLIKGLTTAMEPIIMIILGTGVAFLILSIILPIYKLTTSF
jgi:type IV pilus assembly protein PilC